MGSFRRDRVAESIQEFLATQLPRMNDPRLTLLTLSAVEVSPDLKVAWVYWTSLSVGASAGDSAAPEEKHLAEIEAVLKKIKPILKKKMGKALGLRFTPDLRFAYDRSLIEGARIEELLKDT